ncbi:MAG: arylesterase [Magnetococcales bacterium]|nr:arylesterase [Magnetococcales bacterium]
MKNRFFKTRFLVSLFIVLCLPTVGPGGERVILCYGDSLTAGYGVSSEASYPALLQKRLHEKGFTHRVVNAGVSGDTTAGALNRLSWSLKANPTIAIVTLGANDGLRGLDLDAMTDNLDQIILRLENAGVQVILSGMKIPPNYGQEYTSAFAQVYPTLAKKHNIPLLPFFLAGVAGEPDLTLEDGIHPNEAGYALIFEQVWSILQPLLL